MLLDTWGACTTGEILDHVYFHTEPMEHGIRNKLLDFTKISANLPEFYKRPPSGKKASEINELRKKFLEQVTSKIPPSDFEFTAPKYDAEFFAAMEKLDAGQP